jgi:hypothetical protein
MKLVGQRKPKWPGEKVPPGMVRIHRDIAEGMLLQNGERPFSWLGEYQDRKMTSFVVDQSYVTVSAYMVLPVRGPNDKYHLICTLAVE